MDNNEKKQRIKEIAKRFAEKGILLSPDLLESELKRTEKGLSESAEIEKIVDKVKGQDILIIDKIAVEMIEKEKDINWIDFDKAKTNLEKKDEEKLYNKFVEYAKNIPEKNISVSEVPLQADKNRVIIVEQYEETTKKRTVQDFVDFFNARYKSLEAMLRNRQELNDLMSISRAKKKDEKEPVSVIGMVQDKIVTKNGNVMMTLEDPTGTIRVLVNKTKKDLFDAGQDTVVDEVIGISGNSATNMIFVNVLVRPEIPALSDRKCSPEDGYVIFLSDMHVGSKNFLPDEFGKFIKWINGESGNESQKEIARKVKYVLIAGDLIDGVGIYADQDQDLITKDVYEQYAECASLLAQIPSRIKIIISPGNHDAMRIAEPQPVLYKDFAAALWNLPNVTMVTNPSVVNIDSSDSFSGFNVLIYHGYSFDYYAADVESIRTKGGYDRADLIMKFLLQRRHLAPATSSTLFIPDPLKDPLIISKIPDIFLTGHIHKCTAGHYKNIVLIGGSCWQSKTAFQERVGHHPLPARVPIMNLKTREIKILNFEKPAEEKKEANNESDEPEAVRA